MQKRAFTLIELLVVLAIVAVLAAILFPVFASARAKARQTVCLSNGKQLAAAILLYNGDYDERWIDKYPNYSPNQVGKNPQDGYPEWSPATNGDTYVGYLLQPYVRNGQIFVCPNVRKDDSWGIETPDGTVHLPEYALNMLDNRAVSFPGHVPPDSDGGYQWRFTGPFGRLQSQLYAPAGLMMLWEHNNPTNQCNTWSSEPGHWDTGHSGGFMAAFADGHVKRWTLPRMTNQLVCYWNLP